MLAGSSLAVTGVSISASGANGDRVEMSKGQMLRALVKQRLTAAAEEIFGLFERTIAEYEEELCRSREENERQRETLDAVFKPQLRLNRAVFPADVQVLMVSEEEVLPEQQDWRPSLDQEEPAEPSLSTEEHQLEGLTEFTYTPVPVKSEYEDEKPHLQMRPDGEDWDQTADPGRLDERTGHGSKTRVSEEERKEAAAPPSGVFSKRRNAEEPLSCSECGKSFSRKYCLQIHKRTHTGEKPYSCSMCGQRFNQRNKFIEHTRRHTGQDMFSCALCGKQFAFRYRLRNHMRTHTGEKAFSCSVCGQGFRYRGELVQHMSRHTADSFPSQLQPHSTP